MPLGSSLQPVSTDSGAERAEKKPVIRPRRLSAPKPERRARARVRALSVRIVSFLPAVLGNRLHDGAGTPLER